MKHACIIVALAACGGSSETPVEEITYGDDTVVEGQTDLEKLQAVFEAQVVALRNADADAFLATHRLDAESFMLGPADVAVMVGGDAVNTTVRRVLGNSEPAEVTVQEHLFELAGDTAYSAHTVAIGPQGNLEATYHAVQIYGRVDDGWKVLASSWTVALPNERAMEMAAGGSFGESVPLPERRDPGCEVLATDLEGLRTDTMPPAERVVGGFTFGTAPEEADPFTQEEYDAIAGAISSGAVQSSAGPGSIHVRKVGDLCIGATNVDRTFQHEGNPATIRLRAFIVSNPAAPLHRVGAFSLVLPLRANTEEPAAETAEETQTSP